MKATFPFFSISKRFQKWLLIQKFWTSRRGVNSFPNIDIPENSQFSPTQPDFSPFLVKLFCIVSRELATIDWPMVDPIANRSLSDHHWSPITRWDNKPVDQSLTSWMLSIEHAILRCNQRASKIVIFFFCFFSLSSFWVLLELLLSSQFSALFKRSFQDFQKDCYTEEHTIMKFWLSFPRSLSLFVLNLFITIFL